MSKKSEIPNKISEAKVVLYCFLTEKINLAICTYENSEGYYLFGCDENWENKTDTYHETIKSAKDQAMFEYPEHKIEWNINLNF